MAISAPKDANRTPTLLGTLSSDGVTVISIRANPTANALKVSNGSTGSSFSSVDAQRDADRNATIWGVSSADFTTPIPIYVDSNGNLLTQTT